MTRGLLRAHPAAVQLNERNPRMRRLPAMSGPAPPLPRVVRHCLPAVVAGSLSGVIAAAGLVVTNVGGLRELILHDSQGWIALFLLISGLVVTFGSVALGAAVMGLDGWDEQE